MSVHINSKSKGRRMHTVLQMLHICTKRFSQCSSVVCFLDHKQEGFSFSFLFLKKKNLQSIFTAGKTYNYKAEALTRRLWRFCWGCCPPFISLTPAIKATSVVAPRVCAVGPGAKERHMICYRGKGLRLSLGQTPWQASLLTLLAALQRQPRGLFGI